MKRLLGEERKPNVDTERKGTRPERDSEGDTEQKQRAWEPNRQ